MRQILRAKIAAGTLSECLRKRLRFCEGEAPIKKVKGLKPTRRGFYNAIRRQGQAVGILTRSLIVEIAAEADGFFDVLL
ncbi:hypothetical protein DSCOOX_52460 [Desulfosarcina ovata subsp. ovata]|uniref:Uncharacterized protein n=1 Tax=Desulfosarcina ovata subsp. ovata TaxID=2752305 RepID=A0A5K8AHX3_9BACT|nr:hypothetical protein DSCOOX_52460 [Desulfosarcina ovata subsp. ovata]